MYLTWKGKHGTQGVELASVALGRAHGVAVTQHGRVYAWGSNINGQCGAKASRYDAGVPRPITVPDLLNASAYGHVTVLCCQLSIEFSSATRRRGSVMAMAAAAANATSSVELALATSALATSADAASSASAPAAAPGSSPPRDRPGVEAAPPLPHPGVTRPAPRRGSLMQSADVELKAERWQRSRKQLRASLMLMQGAPSLRDGMAEKALAEASAKAIREERERRMRNWPKGIALWKKALRLLAVERPTLWRVAELHACAEPIPDRLARVAEWYGQLVQSTPRGVIEMQTGFADGAGRTRYRPTVSHRPPPSIACARAADAAARFRIDGSPALQALLSPRTFATASYPKPSAIDVDSLQHGVWSADFSWERGVVPQCGPIDESPGFAGDAALQVWRPPPTQKPARLVLQMGNVAPCTASKPSAVAAGTSGGHRKPPKVNLD